MAILCAVDFSDASGLALAVADRIAATFHEPLVIVHVADPLLAAAEGVQAGSEPIALVTGALASLVDKTLGDGAAARHQLRVPVGEPSSQILSVADEADAQLVILATRGESGVGKFVFGSIAERVLRTATRPVLVVPPSVSGGPMRTLGGMQEVLAPIDFHEHALEDVRIADRVARASQARLRLLHVVPAMTSSRWTVLQQPMAAQLDEQLGAGKATALDAARAALEQLAEALGGTAGPTLEVTEGSIAEQIAAVADRADVDLVVLGLRGVPGLLGNGRMGSVAYRVLCASPVPVLALPHEARHAGTLAFLEGSRATGRG